MNETIVFQAGLIIILGIASQWLAWRMKLPSILFLIIVGILAGPVGQIIRPDEIFGDLLFPFASLSVAIILFEGGLSLRLKEIREIGPVILRLILIGGLITFSLTFWFARTFLGFAVDISLLLSALLIVTGPTVVTPLLHHIKPGKALNDVLKWEGILIDPVGAILAVLVYELIMVHEPGIAWTSGVLLLLKSLLGASIVGSLFAGFNILIFKKFWVPDFLQESLTLSLVIAAFLTSNYIQPESGLLAVTLMGLFMDNQKSVSIHHIIRFKENLRVLIISILFIVLAAHLDLRSFFQLHFSSVIFLAALIFVVRPIGVFISSVKSPFNLKERLFIAFMAPRGIVAAAVASIFALKLTQNGLTGAVFLVPITFFIIIGTVSFYGLFSPLLARLLNLSVTNPRGVLIIGANRFARFIAHVLAEHHFEPLLIDTNRQLVLDAHKENLKAYHGNAIAEKIMDALDLNGIGKLLALTANDEANSLAVLHFDEYIDKKNLFQLVPEPRHVGERQVTRYTEQLQGRYLFGENLTYRALQNLLSSGWTAKSVLLTEKFTLNDFKNMYTNPILLFVISEGEQLVPVTTDLDIHPEQGQTLVALVPSENNNP